MLSRSGLSIRKLIPHRRLSDEDLSGSDLKKEDTLPVSWMDQDSGRKSFNRKKRAPTPIIATSPLTHSDILRPLPPLPSETPRSSASSSCRCEHHADCDCPLLSWKRRSPSISPKEDDEEPTPPSSVSRSNSPDGALPQRLLNTKSYASDDHPSKEDLTRALSPEVGHKEEMPKDWQTGEASPQQFSDNVQKLIQEAEDAFKAIGSTLSEVQSSRPPLPSNTKAGSSDITCDVEPTPPTPPPKETPLPLSKSPSAKALSMLGSSPPATPPKHNPSMTKPKRKKSKKSNQARSMRATRKPTTPKQTVKSGPRWTLTENVSELLTGKLFHRIEADEMLTPDQIEAFKQKRITKLQVDKMVEALEHELIGIPAEPVHSDDSPSRTGSASVKVKAVTTETDARTEEKPVNLISTDPVPRDLTFESQQASKLPSIPSGNRPTFQQKNAPPKMSSRHVRSSSRRLMTELPIIPEASTTPRPNDDRYPSNESNDSLASQSTSDYIYLKSSPYSLNAPAFQHGPIRLSRSEMIPDMKLGADDGLDWTAFQMAILGGAGDFLTGGGETLSNDEADEAAEIIEWWDSSNFGSTGGLVTRNREAPSPASTLSGDEVPDLSYSEVESDNQHTPQSRRRGARRNARASHSPPDSGSTEKKKRNLPSHSTDAWGDMNDGWRKDSEQKEVVANRESASSLPPSPMLDLRVIRSPNGDDLDVVPMGYNLGHDLGDFLKWEAEHAYAGDFSSPIRLT